MARKDEPNFKVQSFSEVSDEKRVSKLPKWFVFVDEWPTWANVVLGIVTVIALGGLVVYALFVRELQPG